MIFSDPLFLFVFLPITFMLFHAGLRCGAGRKIIYILIAASFVFYCAWNFGAGLMLAASIAANFIFYRIMNALPKCRFLMLCLGIVMNVSLLAYFKYAGFFLENAGILLGKNFEPLKVFLPPGISFYTFQQITFLLDCYRTKRKEVRFDEYLSFVLFFPHLIAGPIVHHNEFFPQIRRIGIQVNDQYIWFGVIIFVIGLFKKVVLADKLSSLVSPVFDAANKGADITFFDSWIASIGFTFQIYFDFSAYSDMAVGLALMFGIVLPVNFNSPYKAADISAFWRRWHITLSRFLKENIYIPLGGNHGSALLSARNVLITMLIGGLWHGANWTFVIWGGVHGLALGIHKLWSSKFRIFLPGLPVILTFVFLVLTWVLFRADSLNSALAIYEGMAGFKGAIIPFNITGSICNSCISSGETILDIASYRYAALLFPVLLFIVLFMPNSWQIIGIDEKSCERAMGGNEAAVFGSAIPKSNLTWVLIAALVFVVTCMFVDTTAKFIYFDF